MTEHQVLVERAGTDEAAEKRQRRTVKPRSTVKQQPLSQDTVKSTVESLARPGDWVSIAELRKRLGGTREEQDALLRQMETRDDFHIVPETDQRRLTPEDREAAVIVGGKPNHLVKVSG